jgi:cysteinyl-tRNA synthetase
LWKPSSDDQPGWDSPWGRGRPGWHIECSAMAKYHLGDTFDIHGGGIDLKFPHHENEIAQSRCANKTKYLAKYWVHNGFLMVEGEKMSKSIGNVLLVHDMIEQGIPGEAIRLTLLSTHYRQPLNWTADGLDHSLKTLDKWYKLIDETPQDDDLDFAEEYIAALYNDLNTPQAITVMHAIAKDSPHRLKKCGTLLGILQQSPYEWRESRQVKSNITAEEIDKLVHQRNQARLDKDFTKSDEIRDLLTEKGVVIKDSAYGASWEWA